LIRWLGGSAGWWLSIPVLLIVAATQPVPLPKRHVVEIEGMAFRPSKLEVAVGDTVVWINRDLVSHSATGTGVEKWDTGDLAQDQQGGYVPRNAGDLPYFCRLHPVMQGRLVVR
jgi:plastocyanin